MYAISDAIENGRKNGISSLASSAIKKVKKFIFIKEEYTWNRIDLDSIPNVKPKITVVVRSATLKDIPKFKRIKNSTKGISEWLKKGYLLHISLVGDYLASYACFHTVSNSVFDRIVKLKPDEIWGLYVYTAPEYRGNSIYPNLAYMSAKMLMEKGYKNLYGLIKIDNESSLKVHERMGKKDLERVKYIKFFGIERCWFAKENRNNGERCNN